MIFTEEELVASHTPLFTMARIQVSCVTVPTLEPGSVVVVLLMSVTPELKVDEVDFCHFTTDPTLPLSVKLPEG